MFLLISMFLGELIGRFLPLNSTMLNVSCFLLSYETLVLISLRARNQIILFLIIVDYFVKFCTGKYKTASHTS